MRHFDIPYCASFNGSFSQQGQWGTNSVTVLFFRPTDTSCKISANLASELQFVHVIFPSSLLYTTSLSDLFVYLFLHSVHRASITLKVWHCKLTISHSSTCPQQFFVSITYSFLALYLKTFLFLFQITATKIHFGLIFRPETIANCQKNTSQTKKGRHVLFCFFVCFCFINFIKNIFCCFCNNVY